MKLAAVVPFWLDRPATEALDIASNADELAYDELWVGEMMTFDAFALAGAIARTTSRITLVVGPLPVSTRSPAGLALGISSVATIGGRDAGLALGSSSPMIVTNWHGRRWGGAARRMEETVAALRPILRGERSSFAGRYVSTDGFRLQAPVPGTDIAVAAFGPRMIEAAARIADRLVLNLVTPQQVARVRSRVADIPIVVWVPVAISPGEASHAQIARQLVAYLAPPGYGEMFMESGFHDLVARARSGAHPKELLAAIPPSLGESVSAFGSRDEILARIDEYRSAGADVVAIVPVTAEDEGGRRTLRTLTGG